MIYSLSVKDPKRTPVQWWPKVPYLQRDRFDFGPGMNLFFGPNGSGKTTLLLALARTFCCAQGGVPRLTEAAIHQLTASSPIGSETIDCLLGLDVRHDGRVIGHFDPSHKVGAVGGHFDDDFFDEGLRSVFVKRSSGESQMDGMARVLNQEPEFVDGVGDRVNDLWFGWRKQVLDVTKANEPEGPWTALLDEPERSLDIPRRAKLWATLQRYAKKRQILLATHDPFALFMVLGAGDDVRVFETAPGYVEACWRTLGAVADLAQLADGSGSGAFTGVASSAARTWASVGGIAAESAARLAAGSVRGTDGGGDR